MKPEKSQNFSFKVGDLFETTSKPLYHGGRLKSGLKDKVTYINVKNGRISIRGTSETHNFWFLPEEIIRSSCQKKYKSKFLI